MTAETLTPFITPTIGSNGFPAKHATEEPKSHSKRKTKHLVPIVLGLIAGVLITGILSLTIKQTLWVQKLESDLTEVQKNLENLRERLGIHYLEDMNKFQHEYTNMLIEDPSKADELESGDDDDYDYNEEYSNEDDDTDQVYHNYIDLINEESNGTHPIFNRTVDVTETDTESSASVSSSSASNDDNVFDDFTSYSDSKRRKQQRKSRSIADIRNELQSNVVAQNQSQSKMEKDLKESDVTAETQSPHRHAQKSHSHHMRQGRRRLLVRRGESTVSAKSADYNAANKRSVGNSGTAAAHFHLNRIVPHSRHGDMYVGHATNSMDSQWQQHFNINEGILTVHHAGLYYVYAQICYNDNHDQNGFIIYHGQNQFLQCLNTVPTNMPLKLHTCHTSGLIQLQENDSIHLRDIHQDRNVVLRDSNNRSFFGIIKI